MADAYIKMLSQIAMSLETTYGLHEVNPETGIEIADCDADVVVEYVRNDIRAHGNDVKRLKNKNAARDTILLSYVANRIEFFGYIKVDFKKYPALQEVARILLAFTGHKTVTTENKRAIGKSVALMTELDKKQVMERVGLAYKYLRIFVVMTLYGNAVDASIVADFIISQFVVKRSD